MIQVKILVSGCAKCSQLADEVKAVIASEGIDAVVEVVDDIQQIVAYNVLATPALVVNGEVRSSGRVPSREEISSLLSGKPKGCCGNHAAGIGKHNGSCC